MESKRFLAVSSLALCAFIHSLAADVAIQMQHQAGSQPQAGSQTMTLSFSGENVRMDSPQGGMILRPQQNEMIMLMHEQKQFMKQSLDQATGGAATAQGQPDPDAMTFTKTGNKQVINGFSCEEVVGTESDGDVLEFWLSPESVSVDEFLSAMKAFEKMQQKSPGAGKMKSWTEFFQGNPDLSTFPIRTINKNAAGVVESISTVQSISRDTLSQTLFQIPAGYTEISMGATIPPASPGTAAPSMPAMPSQSVMQELQALQQEIQKSGRPTPEQMQRLQELAAKMQGR
jgi:hypothetical protein